LQQPGDTRKTEKISYQEVQKFSNFLRRWGVVVGMVNFGPVRKLRLSENNPNLVSPRKIFTSMPTPLGLSPGTSPKNLKNPKSQVPQSQNGVGPMMSQKELRFLKRRKKKLCHRKRTKRNLLKRSPKKNPVTRMKRVEIGRLW
jgi:hypothetical protein